MKNEEKYTFGLAMQILRPKGWKRRQKCMGANPSSFERTDIWDDDNIQKDLSRVHLAELHLGAARLTVFDNVSIRLSSPVFWMCS